MDDQELSRVLAQLDREGVSEATRDAVEDLVERRSAEPVAPPPGAWPVLDPQRFELGALLGQGGMGRVDALQDRVLGRTVAWKRSLLGRHRDGLLREAQLTARLSHPGIPPVHDVGTLPGLGPGYSMRLLAEHVELFRVIDALHASAQPLWRASVAVAGVSGTWTLWGVVQALRQVADTLAYAHRSGLVHRDVKPSNVMVGGFGEVYLVDWGLGLRQVLQDGEPAASGAGSAGFRAPETTTGGPITSAVDVYALGATLHRLLGGAQAADAHSVADLAALADACTDADPASRPSAEAVSRALVSWLDGAAQRARARALWASVEPVLEQLDHARRAHIEAQTAAEIERARTPSWAELDGKRALFSAVDRVEQAQESLRALRMDALEGLQRVLALDPMLAPARAALDELLLQDHAQAERLGLHSDTTGFLRASPSRRVQDYLRAPATLSLRTRPAGLSVRVVAVKGRSVARLDDAPVLEGVTPIEHAPLPPGSHVAFVGERQLPVPLFLARGASLEVGPLAVPDVLPRGTAWIPGGPFIAGSSTAPFSPGRTRVHVPGFLIQRTPVCNRDYLVFLNDVRQRRAAHAVQALVPRTFSIPGQRLGEPLYAGDPGLGFHLDPERTPGWALDHPVVYLPWTSAVAYAQWLRERSGRPWRLPFELEWEKAGRGVDGRTYPWGDRFDASFACVQGSRPDARAHAPELAATRGFAMDQSVYGVRHMGGNVLDWCLDPWRIEGPFDPCQDWRPLEQPGPERAFRGGHWYSEARELAQRGGFYESTCVPTTGFRLVARLGDDHG